MIPTLYASGTTDFETLGLGVLTECISCNVRTALNGVFELEMKYPVSGARFAEIGVSCVIKAQSQYHSTAQLFDIYAISKPINGIVTINATHVSSRRQYIPVMPCSASNIAAALNAIDEHCAETNPFTLTTDKSTVAEFNLIAPASLGQCLGGMSGSLLDVYGGEYEFDNFTIKLWSHRGSDNGVTLRYGKNITNFRQDESLANVVTGVCPYWTDGEETVVLPEQIIENEYADRYPFKHTVTQDFSMSFEEKPTVAQLRAVATSWVNATGRGVPTVRLDVSFEHLAQYEEYKDIALLEEVHLGDTVHVYFEPLDVTATARVVETRYDVLNDKYSSVKIGSVRANLSQIINTNNAEANQKIDNVKSALAVAFEKAVDALSGADGGNVVIRTNAAGQPYEILIMDTDNVNTALNVLRLNMNGLGLSTNGINGPYTIAMTADGIVADTITAGTLQGIEIIGEDGKIGGWEITSSIIEKWSKYEDGVPTTVYRAFLSAPENPADNYLAIGIEKYDWDGSNLTLNSQPFRVRYDGLLRAMNAIIEGEINASSGSITGDLNLTGSIKGANSYGKTLFVPSGLEFQTTGGTLKGGIGPYQISGGGFGVNMIGTDGAVVQSTNGQAAVEGQTNAILNAKTQDAQIYGKTGAEVFVTDSSGAFYVLIGGTSSNTYFYVDNAGAGMVVNGNAVWHT